MNMTEYVLLSDNELELLMALLSYPEKFWKIINQYINSNTSRGFQIKM